MANYYLDIETTGLKPHIDQITTIQYQQLDFDTGAPIGPLVILKAWETSEKDILEKFAKVFGTAKWGFVAHGYNLGFEHKFLSTRSIGHGLLNPIDLFSRPYVDLHHVGIMLNGGNLKGSGLNKISGKTQNGMYCLECYRRGDYKAVEDYIVEEAVEYIRLYKWLKLRMPGLRDKFQTHMDGINNE